MNASSPKSRFDEIRLGEAVVFQRGFDITKSEQTEGNIPIISSSGVSSYHNKWKVMGPGVVIGRKGTLGTVHYIKGNYWPHDTTLWVKNFKGNDARLVSYFLQTLKLENFDTGSSNPTLNRNHIHKIKVLFPRYQVQRKIAAILSAYDDLIENNKRRIALLEKMAEEVYREWFVRMRFPGHEKVKKVKGVPEGWDVLSFSDLVEINPLERIDKSEEVPFVGMEDLSLSSMYFAVKESRKGASGSKFRNRDVLFPRITPSVENGKRGVVMSLEENQVGCGSTEFIVMREKVIGPEHIYFITCSSEFRKHAELSMTGASGRQRVQEDCFSYFLVKTPSSGIRRKFAEIVSPHFQQIEVFSLQNEKLIQARDMLLPRLISGKLSVENLDIMFPPSMEEHHEI